MPTVAQLLAPLFAIAVTAVPSAAQDAAPGPSTLSLELNDLSDVAGACQVSFLVGNTTGADLDAVVFEAVLIDGGGRIERLTLFDFGALPDGRPRVRQFVVPDLACGALGRILINGAHRCDAGGAPSAACTDGLHLTTRTGAELVG